MYNISIDVVCMRALFELGKLIAKQGKSEEACAYTKFLEQFNRYGIKVPENHRTNPGWVRFEKFLKVHPDDEYVTKILGGKTFELASTEDDYVTLFSLVNKYGSQIKEGTRTVLVNLLNEYRTTLEQSQSISLRYQNPLPPLKELVSF